MRMLLIPALCAVALAACSATPLVTKQKMTLAQANIEGLECRPDKAIDTNIPRTICASPQAWAKYDARKRQESADLMAEGKKLGNAGRYNRN